VATSSIGSGNGPGVSDVADFLIELSREWGGLHSIILTADRDRKGRPRLFMVLRRKPSFSGNTDGKEVRVWTAFPCPENRTLCGAMYRLCHEINEKLHKRKIEREAQTAF